MERLFEGCNVTFFRGVTCLFFRIRLYLICRRILLYFRTLRRYNCLWIDDSKRLHPIILQYTTDCTVKDGQTEGNMWSFTRRFTVFCGMAGLRQYQVNFLPVACAVFYHTLLNIYVSFKFCRLCFLSHKSEAVIDLL